MGRQGGGASTSCYSCLCLASGGRLLRFRDCLTRAFSECSLAVPGGCFYVPIRASARRFRGGDARRVYTPGTTHRFSPPTTQTRFHPIQFSTHKKQNEYKFLILGVGGAGKTFVLESLKTKYSPTPGLGCKEIVPTVGLNLARLDGLVPNGTCLFWDLGGRHGLRGIWEKYYSECDGVLFVVATSDGDGSLDSKDSKDSSESFQASLEVLAEVVQVRSLAWAPVLVLVNDKNDKNESENVASKTLRLENVLASVSRKRATRVSRLNSDCSGVTWLVETAVGSERTRERLGIRAVTNT